MLIWSRHLRPYIDGSSFPLSGSCRIGEGGLFQQKGRRGACAGIAEERVMQEVYR